MSARALVFCEKRKVNARDSWSYIDVRDGKRVRRKGFTCDEKGVPIVPYFQASAEKITAQASQQVAEQKAEPVQQQGVTLVQEGNTTVLDSGNPSGQSSLMKERHGPIESEGTERPLKRMKSEGPSLRKQTEEAKPGMGPSEDGHQEELQQGQDKKAGEEEKERLKQDGCEGCNGEDELDELSGPRGFYDSDPACCQCDDGGVILMCDGPCLRSFHAGMRESDEPDEEPLYDAKACNPVKIPHDLFEALTQQGAERFNCPNCLAGIHQCFVCKCEGTADEVFRCTEVNCGKHYHPECVDKTKEEMRVAFTCGLHSCANKQCKQVVQDCGELIPCRRCPEAYHEKCMPEDLLKVRDGRIWIADKDADGRIKSTSMVERSLIYCLKHPMRNNVVPHKRPLFTKLLLQRFRMHYCMVYPQLASSKDYFRAAIKKNMVSPADFEELPLLLRMLISKEQRRQSISIPSILASPMSTQRSMSSHRKAESNLKPENSFATSAFAGLLSPASGSIAGPTVPPHREVSGAEASVIPAFLREPSHPGHSESGAGMPICQETPKNRDLEQSRQTSVEKGAPSQAGLLEFEQDSYWTVEAIEQRVLKDMEEAMSKYSVPAVRAEMRVVKPYDRMDLKSFPDGLLDSILTAVKVKERSGEAMDGQLKSLIHDGFDKMRHVVAPFIHGQRYTSYGRHFTKGDRLEKLCNLLKPFLLAEDIVVDFSCGSNDFLHMLRRMCIMDGFCIHCKAFDIITPFHMEFFAGAKSWFDVTKDDLCVAGSQFSSDRLVIGLNPPFGKNASLANEFVSYAVDKFQPRMLVLIVPKITKVPPGYVMLLEDETIMRDKSFHIPGLNDRNKASWNKDVPCIRFLVQRKHTVAACSFGPPSFETVLGSVDWETPEGYMYQHPQHNQAYQLPPPYETIHQPWFAIPHVTYGMPSVLGCGINECVYAPMYEAHVSSYYDPY